MSDRLRAMGAVIRDRNLRRIQLAYLGFVMAENGTWVAILVYAYSSGGAAAAGLVVVIQLVPSALVAPFAAYAGDRFRRDRVLSVGYLAQALTTGATAVALLSDAPRWAIYLCATTAAVAVTFTRPTQNALLPGVTSTPEDLTAANAVMGVVEGVGLFAGPFLAGVLLSISEPGVVFAVFTATSLVSAALVVNLRLDRAAVTPSVRTDAEIVWRDTLMGFSTLRTAREPRLLVLLLGSGVVVTGALDVLYVATAVDLLGMGAGGAGFLSAAFGIGSVVGAAGSVLLVGRRRLTPPIAAGSVVLGAPIAVIGALPSATAAPVLFAVSGAGWNVSDVAGRTLLQRVSPDVVMARIFGVLEGMIMISLAMGSVGAAILLETAGVGWTLVAVGAFLPVTIVITWRQLRSIESAAGAPSAEVIALLRRLPLFAPLPAPTMERLVANLVPVEIAPGEILIREGDEGDRFYVLVEGEAEVTIAAERVAVVRDGDYVGELALLRDSPRAATVTARTPMRLLALEREPFLQAVTGHPQSHAAAETSMRRYGAGNAAEEP